VLVYGADSGRLDVTCENPLYPDGDTFVPGTLLTDALVTESESRKSRHVSGVTIREASAFSQSLAEEGTFGIQRSGP
jgi:hypothetical protein